LEGPREGINFRERESKQTKSIKANKQSKLWTPSTLLTANEHKNCQNSSSKGILMAVLYLAII